MPNTPSTPMRQLHTTEAELQAAVIDVAHRFGWTVAHFRAARTSSGGWVTPVAADGAGFPDLVLVHADPPSVKFRELKSARGKIAADQEQWGRMLTFAGADYAVWRPDQLADIIAELSFGRARNVL